MKVEELLQVIEFLAPPELCAAWDNSGFLVGNRQQVVERALVVLDVTKETVTEAIANQCQLMISHHPLIFKPMKRVVDGDYQGELLQLLIKNDIALISAHTNLDNAPMGVNFALASALKLENVHKLAEDNDDPTFMGSLPSRINGQSLLEKIKADLDLNYVCATKLDPDKRYQSIAVCGGAGADLWQQAKRAGADCLLTAEGKHHIGIEALHFGMTVIDAGHFGTEKIILPVLASYLTKNCPDVEIIRSKIDTNPWEIY